MQKVLYSYVSSITTGLVLGFILLFSGCSTFSLGDLDAVGAESSAFCTRGGPGGTLGIGPGGIIAGARTNSGFEGRVIVNQDCSLSIESD